MTYLLPFKVVIEKVSHDRFDESSSDYQRGRVEELAKFANDFFSGTFLPGRTLVNRFDFAETGEKPVVTLSLKCDFFDDDNARNIEALENWQNNGVPFSPEEKKKWTLVFTDNEEKYWVVRFAEHPVNGTKIFSLAPL